MRVKAKRLGWYGNRRVREGDIFVLSDPLHFSKEWMEHPKAKKKDADEFEDEELEADAKPKPGKGKSPSNKEVI